MNPRDTARKLVELAADERTPEKERVVAAIQVVGVIHKYGLLDSPFESVGDLLRSENETIQAARKLYDVFSDPDVSAALKAIGGRAWEAAKRR